MQNDEFERGKQIAYRFLSYKPRSKKEVEKKLKEKNISGENISNIISLLEKNNYLNDREFTLNWLRYRMENRPLGKRSLEYELREKGIDSEIIKESLDEVYAGEFDEYEVAVRLAEKKMVSLKKRKIEHNVTKKRLFGHLQRKGFSYDTIEKVVNDIFENYKHQTPNLK